MNANPTPHDDIAQPPTLGLVRAPSAQELSDWIDELDHISDELIDDEAPSPPERDTQPAVLRAGALQIIRRSLLGALHIRASADAGVFVGNDPDALPIGGSSAPA